jgi:two-component system, response regulator
VADDTIDILVVEDSIDDWAFVVHALTASDLAAQLRVARDGAEALALVFGDEAGPDAAPLIRPKLVVLDLKLPKVDGLEVLRRLKSNPSSRSIPVVVLTSSQEAGDLSESYRLGANSYLVKPMDFDSFADLVRELGKYWLRYNQPPPAGTPTRIHGHSAECFDC